MTQRSHDVWLKTVSGGVVQSSGKWMTYRGCICFWKIFIYYRRVAWLNIGNRLHNRINVSIFPLQQLCIWIFWFLTSVLTATAFKQLVWHVRAKATVTFIFLWSTVYPQSKHKSPILLCVIYFTVTFENWAACQSESRAPSDKWPASSAALKHSSSWIAS